MRLCDACGKPLRGGGIDMGGAMLCRDCEPAVRMEMEILRAARKPINALHIAKRIYRETHDARNYLLRDIPEDLWTKAKHRAIDDGDSLRGLILKSLVQYLNKDHG
jgi:hypothetical protein